MNKNVLKATKEVLDEISVMSDEEFKAELEEHKDSGLAKALQYAYGISDPEIAILKQAAEAISQAENAVIKAKKHWKTVAAACTHRGGKGRFNCYYKQRYRQCHYVGCPLLCK